MSDKQSKLDQLKLLGANRLAKSSGGGGESGPARTRPSRDGAQVPRGDEGAGLAPGPLEANSVAPQPRGGSLQTNATQPSGSPNKRAPRGTFDRTAYQRDLMRKRRQAEKREAGK